MRNNATTTLREPPTIAETMRAAAIISEWILTPSRDGWAIRSLDIRPTRRGKRMLATLTYPWPGYGNREVNGFIAPTLADVLILVARDIAEHSETDASHDP